MLYRNTKNGVVVNTSSHVIGNVWVPIEAPAADDKPQEKKTTRRRKAKTND